MKHTTLQTSLLSLLYSLVFGLWGCAPVPAGSGSSTSSGPLPSLRTQDRQYTDNIRSVQLFPDDGTPTSQLLPAVTSIADQNRLVLHFDDLQPDRQDYAARIVHCDYNWQVSRLSTLEYLYEYNEYPINNFSFSINNLQPYVHYQLEVPPVKISGNYLLVVYRNRNPNDVVITRRFMVYENGAPISPQLVAAPGAARLTHQQIDLEVLYRSLQGIVDPMSQIKVVIRQNQRWDNAVFNLRPTADRTGTQSLEFKLFDLSNAFPGGNEFRFFDMRTIRALGQNVGDIQVDSVRNSLDAFLLPDKPRGQLAYAQREDINGEYIISNQEYADPYLSSEYIEVHFFLKVDAPLPQPVYVAGDFSNYQAAPPYMMQYDAALSGYRADILLKQGWYNYQYYLTGNNKNALSMEGSFSETENFYEIFVYYRPYSKPADLLVGYSNLRTGGRR